LNLNRLFISPKFQNRGIGAKVLADIVSTAHQNGFSVKLSVLTTNPAIKFYQRAGFSVIDETPERITLIQRHD
jgi:ribosomal protein S18 acetylase RimI-like enzyme